MLCVSLYEKVELCCWWEYGDEKTRINKLNEKRSFIPWGLRVPIWKIIFFLVFCGFRNCLDVRKGRKLPYVVENDLEKRPTKAAQLLFGGPTSVKKKLWGNFLAPPFMLK